MSNRHSKAFQGYDHGGNANDDQPEPKPVTGTLKLGGLTIGYDALAWPNGVLPESVAITHAAIDGVVAGPTQVIAIIEAALEAGGGTSLSDIIADKGVAA